MVSLTQFDAIFNVPQSRTDAGDKGYFAYYQGKSCPTSGEERDGWLEAKGISDFVKCLSEEGSRE